jgi:hypothetical protein
MAFLILLISDDEVEYFIIQDIGLQGWTFLINLDCQISHLQDFVGQIILIFDMLCGTCCYTLEYLFRLYAQSMEPVG